jgi:nucleoside-diphosphate-sugar epimerase
VKKKIIAITGATGFVGSFLIDNLLRKNFEIRILSRSFKIKKKNNIKFFHGNLVSCDFEILKKFTKNVDILYNCAAEIYNKKKMYSLHVTGTKRLLEASKGQVRKWVQLSSVGVYETILNKKNTVKTCEESRNYYELTKLISDELLVKSGLNYIILRPSTIFGNRMYNESLKKIIKFLKIRLFFYLDSNSIVNYVHISDVILVLLLLSKNDLIKKKTYILSDSIKLIEMIEAFCQGIYIKIIIIKFPKKLIIFFFNLFKNFACFAQTKNILKFLLNKISYDSFSLKKDLKFKFKKNLFKLFVEYAKNIK